jgi:hypothetical protein
MDLDRQRCRQIAVSIAIWLAWVVTAHAGDPEPAQGGKVEGPRPVRQAGGERGLNVRAKRVSEPAEGSASDVAPGPDRERVQQKIRAAHEAIERARAQAGSERSSREARGAMRLQSASDSAQSGPQSADHAPIPEAKRAEGRRERAQRARQLAWRGMMHRFQRPGDIPPDMRDALRHHARRLSRLQRIRVLAQAQRDGAAVERTDRLIAREQARHQKQLRAHWDAPAQAETASAPAAPPPANPKAAAANPDPDELGDEPDPETPEDENEERGGEP